MLPARGQLCDPGRGHTQGTPDRKQIIHNGMIDNASTDQTGPGCDLGCDLVCDLITSTSDGVFSLLRVCVSMCDLCDLNIRGSI